MIFYKKIRSKLKALRKILHEEELNASAKEHAKYNSYMFFRHVKINSSIIGKYTYIADNSIIQSAEIGKFCSIGPNVIIGYGEHPTNHLSTSPVFYDDENMFGLNLYTETDFNGKEKVIIGNDVWIGASVYIKNGIKIGDGAIIGAGSVVTKSIPPYAIVVGVPAKIVRFRYLDVEIKELLKIKWWEWDIQKINSLKMYFNQKDISSFLLFIKNQNASQKQ